MNWTLIIIGLIVLVGLFAVVGLVKNILRLVVALIVAVLAAMAANWIIQALGLSQSVPDFVVLIVGAFAAFAVLARD